MIFEKDQDKKTNPRRRPTNPRRQSGNPRRRPVGPRRGFGFKVLLSQFYIETKNFFSTFKKDYSYVLRKA